MSAREILDVLTGTCLSGTVRTTAQLEYDIEQVRMDPKSTLSTPPTQPDDIDFDRFRLKMIQVEIDTHTKDREISAVEAGLGEVSEAQMEVIQLQGLVAGQIIHFTQSREGVTRLATQLREEDILNINRGGIMAIQEIRGHSVTIVIITDIFQGNARHRETNKTNRDAETVTGLGILRWSAGSNSDD